MAKIVDRGRTVQSLQFVREFSCVHGFGPTIREIAEGVGLRSTSTVVGYLDRMTRDGLITSIPSIPRSIRVVEQNLTEDACEDGSSLVCCKFKFPEGTYPMSIIAMVADGDRNNMVPIQAEKTEILRTSGKHTELAR